MLNFENYSYSRLYLDQSLEFFFILGVNDSDNFDEYWDGRTIEVVGYVSIYTNTNGEQENYIYLINQTSRDYESIIKHTKQFINQMSLATNPLDKENFKISKTNILGKLVEPPYTNFIKSVIKNDIPNIILKD
ncbi:hypothetical protein KQI46_03195 [Lysinibacillus capsici]|uniref:hypothetical protein n=1 Tax=Lysinibacillus capsici TaxID=2115968 RepID=UPI001C10015D|nr:hypothetical protein [Lysinibacillus capsici]MBU5250943.1 hypothetical protein [Lysinibacillus capsici]